MNSQRRDRGITLIELVVVMVIIALFATLVGQRVFGKLDKAKQTAAREQMATIESTLDLFRLDVGRYPSTEEGLQALQVKPANVEGWDGPYLKQDVPLDPWGHPYVFRSPGQHGDFDLMTLGLDGQEGGEGNNTDIVNWKK